MAASARYTQKMVASGVVLDDGRPRPPDARHEGRNARTAKSRSTDGPFAETKELIDGFALVKADSKEEAIRLATEFMQIAGDGVGEVLQVFEMGEAPPKAL